MKKRETREEKRQIRKRRIRRVVFGTSQRPRISVKKSLRHIYAQAIDDSSGITIVAKSSLSPEIREFGKLPKTQIASLVGKYLGKQMIDMGIWQAVFDRGGHKYHGRVKSLAEAMREAGVRM